MKYDMQYLDQTEPDKPLPADQLLYLELQQKYFNRPDLFQVPSNHRTVKDQMIFLHKAMRGCFANLMGHPEHSVALLTLNDEVPEYVALLKN